jgi:integrase
MNTAEHRYVGALLHDRIVGALELCCRRGEMLLMQNKRVNWDTCQIGIPGATAKDKENRRVPFNPKGRIAAILKRRAALGPDAYVFGSATGTYQPNIQTAWESLRLLANGIDSKPEERERHGIESSSNESISAGMTWVTKAPVACSRMASTSGSFN